MEENKTNHNLPDTIEIKTGTVSIPLYGLIGGVIGIVVTIIMYVGGLDTWFNPVLNYAWFIAIIAIGIIAAVQIKRLNDGHLMFNTSLKYIFGISAIGTLLVYITHYILMNFVDTSFADAVNVRTAEVVSETFRKFGMGEAEIEKMTEDISKYNNYSLSKILIGYGVNLIYIFVISAIASLIIKKNKYKHLGL